MPAYRAESGLVPAFTSFLAKGGREPTRPPTYIQPFETFFLAFTGLSEYTASTLQNSLFSLFILCYIYTPQKRIRNEKNDNEKKPTVWSSAWATHVFMIILYVFSDTCEIILCVPTVQPIDILVSGIKYIYYVDYSVKVHILVLI